LIETVKEEIKMEEVDVEMGMEWNGVECEKGTGKRRSCF
jgi:hypothetical protein